MNLKKLPTVILAACVVALCATALFVQSCDTLQRVTAGDVATHSSAVPAGTPMIPTGVEVLDDTGFPTGDEWVIVDASAPLPEGSPRIDPESVAAGDKSAIATLFGAIGGFLPAPVKPFVPLVGFMLTKLFGKRYRQNWGEAVAKAARGDLSGALRGVAAAEGIVHTSEDPAVLMAVATKKAAVAKASEAATAAAGSAS